MKVSCLRERQSPREGSIEQTKTEIRKEIQTSEVKKMEVHHHPKVERKNLEEYFLEFVMIFLAVTLGFFAETIRENISENAQAKELAKSLYKEIYLDSINTHQKIQGRLEKEDYIKYFVRYVHDSDLVNLSPNFYPAFTSTFISTLTIIFQSKDGILNQLKNSGALRYFKSSKLQEEIGNINVDIANLKEGNNEEEIFRDSRMRVFIIDHYDYDWFEALAAMAQQKLNNPYIEGWFKRLDLTMIKKPVIINSAQFNRQEAANLASEYLVTIRGFRLIL